MGFDELRVFCFSNQLRNFVFPPFHRAIKIRSSVNQKSVAEEAKVDRALWGESTRRQNQPRTTHKKGMHHNKQRHLEHHRIHILIHESGVSIQRRFVVLPLMGMRQVPFHYT